MTFPGFKHLLSVYAKIGGITLFGSMITHGLAAIPTAVAIAITTPAKFGYLVFAFIGWITLNASENIDIVIWDTEKLEAVNQWYQSQNKSGKIVLFALLIIYLNLILAVATSLGIFFETIVSWPAGVLAIVLIYPWFDLMLGLRTEGYSPGWIVIQILVKMLHLVGIIHEFSLSDIFRLLRRDRRRRGLSGSI